MTLDAHPQLLFNSGTHFATPDSLLLPDQIIGECFAFKEHCGNRSLDLARGAREPFIGVSSREPVEHHLNRKDRGHRIGFVFSGVLWSAAVYWFKHSVLVADITADRQS